MNAIDFIDLFLTQNNPFEKRIDASQAYNSYINYCSSKNIETSTYPYFRTKFNNKIKELQSMSNPPIQENANSVTVEGEFVEEFIIPIVEIEQPPIIAFEIPEARVELTRVVKNYKNGDEVPTPPSLIPTGTLFDKLISDRITTPEHIETYLQKYGEDMPEENIEVGGFTRKCVDIIAGKAGSGKTTSACILAVKAKYFMKREYGVDIRVGFISGEMRESEWAKEITKSEMLKELEVDYMLNYVGQNNYEDIFWEAVADYDIVIVDSFPAILGHIRMSPNEKRVEKTIINDFIRKILQIVEERNNNVQLINQCNKDGSYKGGTELPHMLSSLRYVMVEGNKRYMMWEKNRNNGSTIGQKAYFDKDEHEGITFNQEVYDATYNSIEDKKQTLEELFSSLNSAKLEEELQEMESIPEEIITERGDFQGGGHGYLVDRNPLTQD
jgi:hypothetical protein